MSDTLVYNKDIIRLNLLHTEYTKQKNRIIALMEFDCKLIGITIVAEHLGFSINYFYKLFKEKSISHDTLEELYMKVQDLKQILKVEGVEDK